MPRLIDWPTTTGIIRQQKLAGPRTIGAGLSESQTGFIQTVGSPFGLWRWQLTLTPMRGESYRRYRGTIAALNGPYNALRVTFYDPDGFHLWKYTPWSNGSQWSNGASWATLADTVSPLTQALKGATQIELADENWANDLGLGDWIGFTPNHFGLYTITQVLGPRQFRIWPPLRKQVETTDECTLLPTVAMRLESESAAVEDRGLEVSEGATMTLIEVEHDDVVTYFTE